MPALARAPVLCPTPTPTGQTQSEGGFAANRVSAASLLDVSEDTDKKGKKYYKYELLVRTGEMTRARLEPGTACAREGGS